MNPVGARTAGGRRRSLFTRVFATNAVVMAAALVLLALSPATVSSPISLEEAIVAIAGLMLLLVVDLLLMHRTFVPLEELRRAMSTADPLSPGARLDINTRDVEVAELADAFNEMIDRLQVERREAARRTLIGQETERRRVAQELHDEIGQTMTALLLQLRQTRRKAPGQIAEELGDIQEEVRGALDDVRRIVGQLRPDALDHLGLGSALVTLAERITEATGIEIVCAIEGTISDLGPEKELVVYRIAQEGLTNVARHSNASRARLDLRSDGEWLTLTLHDDGVGLDGDAANGYGIQGMRERAMLVDARLSIDSPAGSGVVVNLELPVAGELA